MKFCVIGPLSKDRIIISDIKHIEERPGGTAFYSSSALASLGKDVTLLAKLSAKDFRLSERINAKKILIPSKESDIFVNKYPSRNSNEREQEILSIINPFTKEDTKEIKDFDFVHIGPLMDSEISPDIIRAFKNNNKRIALDVQGMIRERKEKKVINHSLKEKEFLQDIDILKADAAEAAIVTGEKNSIEAAKAIASLGCREVLITFGSRGSLVYDGKEFYNIPAFPPARAVDTTGCGDTYVAGYIAKRSESANLEECGKFAAMCATLKIEQGVLKASKHEVESKVRKSHS
jgi:sugar/nucleoside kinase (ribokinase family)